MLRNRSKIILYYATNTIKSILGLRKQYSNNSVRARERLDPMVIPKYINQLDKPYIYHPNLIKTQKRSNNREGKTEEELLYFIDICRFRQQILPVGFPETVVIGCGGLIKAPKRGVIRYVRSSPGGTFEGRRCSPIHVKWRNRTDMPVMMHLHGGEASKPDILYETNNRKEREAYHLYTNNIEAACYWYHGQSNINSLIGFYILKAGRGDICFNSYSLDLPSSKYEYPIVIQDYSFYKDGSIKSTIQKANDTDKLRPALSECQYYGDTIVVNGKAWPNLDVERRQYRFYILNGSVSRFYNLMLSKDMNFTVIGGDKGLLTAPVSQKELLLAPGERADVLIDFSRQPSGSKVLLRNDAKTPYPYGDVPYPESTGQIMRFTIPEYESISITPVKLPDSLRDLPTMPTDLPQSIHIISENLESGDNSILFNGQKCDIPINIVADIDAQEEWCLVNLTKVAYPVYFKQTKFRILSRQRVDILSFKNQKLERNEEDSIFPYLIGEPKEPENYETGWKDTLRADPETVTRIIMQPYNK